MALLQVNFSSLTLQRKVSMQVILPSDHESGRSELPIEKVAPPSIPGNEVPS